VSIKKLLTGSLFAMVISIAVSPITTRLYSPGELGSYTLILTIISMVGPVICAKYDVSIVSAENDKESYALVVLSFYVTIILAVIVTICSMVYLSSIKHLISDISIFSMLIMFLLIITGLINILNSYNNRNKQYNLIASAHVKRNIFQNIGLIVFGLIKMGTIGLLLSQVIGALFGIKSQSKEIKRNISHLKAIKIKNLMHVGKKYKNQPIYSMPAHFANSASYSMLNFFIIALFDLNVLGYYSLAYRILGLPLGLISTNISKVYFQKAFEEKNNLGNYYKSYKQISLLVLSIAIPMVIVLMLFSPVLFKIIFGDNWEIAGVFVRILAPMYGIRLIVSTLVPSLTISGKQRIELLLQLFFLLASLVAFVVCKIFLYSIFTFLSLISFLYFLIYLLFYVIMLRLSRS
jgi:O-antigen/teichoic acid export membrane protein